MRPSLATTAGTAATQTFVFGEATASESPAAMEEFAPTGGPGQRGRVLLSSLATDATMISDLVCEDERFGPGRMEALIGAISNGLGVDPEPHATATPC